MKRYMMLCVTCIGVVSGLCAAAPSSATVKESEGENNRVIVMQVEDDDGQSQKFVVQMKDGSLSLSINGEKIQPGEIDIEDGALYRKKDDGSREKLFKLKFLPNSFDRDFEFEMEMDGLSDAFGKFDSQERVNDHPPVMMGIQLAQPSKALAYHLGIDADSSTLIVAVHKDLPADKAGLRVHDVIVAINGEDDADPEALRKALSDKQPGEQLELQIIQGGETKEIVVDLVAYEQTRLRTESIEIEMAPGFTNRGEQERVMRLQDFASRLQGRLRGFTFDQDDLRELFIAPGARGEHRVFRAPRPPRPPRPPQPAQPPQPLKGFDAEKLRDMISERLEGHQGRTERLAERLEAIEDNVQRLVERMEELISRFDDKEL